MEGLTAEGVPCGVGAHGQPIYGEGPFANMAFFDQLGCARKGSLYEGESITARCIVQCGKGLCRRSLQFLHALFLGGVDDMERILEAFHKLRETRR